jgi:electron transfer flavoprotein beta subunit
MGGMNILVCVKQVPDPEGPPAAFEVDAEAKRVVPKGIPPVLSPFDENALEAAIRLKEEHGGTVTLLSVGSGLSKAVMLKAMASGADRLVMLDDPACDRERLDGHATASLLAAAVSKLGGFDLILAGRQAADTNAGVVGLGLARLLGLPAVSCARRVEAADGGLRVEAALPDGYAVFLVEMPALVTVSHEVGDLRYPSLMAIKQAKTLPVEELSLAELGVDPEAERRLELVSLAPPSRERRCRLVEADSPEEAGRRLAELLREEKVI